MPLSEKEELELLTLEREKAMSSAQPEDARKTRPFVFGETGGGAAVGNPNIQRQGVGASRSNEMLDVVGPIAGAGAAGAVAGFAAPEILTGIGGGLRMLPYPIAQTAGGALMGAGNLIRGGRGAAAIAGGISGAAGESVGQTAEALGAGPVTAEVARVVGGGLSAETAKLGKEVLKAYAVTPAMNLFSKGKHMTAKLILEKLDSAPQTLTDQEAKFVEQMIAEIRGPQGKTNAPLEQVGSIMGAEGQRLLSEADQKMIAAQAQAAGSRPSFPGATKADIGTTLQDTINTRYKGAIAARQQEYSANEAARDAVVKAKETARQFVNKTPEYEAVVKEIQGELAPGKRSPSVQASYQKILSDLTNPEKDVFGQPKPITFQALDDVRRKLGDAFRGKPAEGYDAIGEQAAKNLYGKVSNIQEKYAGPAQRKLLDDYALRTEGLQTFSSKYGKKSTALDQYREDQFATDPSALPDAYFKTRASVQALKELTGNPAMVNHAALEYANRELAGKDAAGVRKWMASNAEWLAETGFTRRLIDNYATGLESAERSMLAATTFADKAAKDNSILTRQSLPAQRAVDLIKSGDTELWSKVTPAIVRSPQAKQQVVSAVRQVIGDQATAKGTIDLFERNIRPFIEGSGISNKAEMDFIATRLAKIQSLDIPEPEKLGFAKRILLQSTAGWAASAAGRGTTWAAEKVVPD